MENVSLSEMELLVHKLSEVKKKLEEISEQEKKAQEVRRELEGQILSHLKANGTTGYLSSVGSVDIRTSLSYKTPKDIEQKEKLFEYIKSKGHDVYMSLLSIKQGNGYYLVPRNRDLPYSGWKTHHIKSFSKIAAVWTCRT